MTTRKLHKTIGLILLLPFIAWSLTAVFFLVRPNYEEAYERLVVREYPMTAPYTIPADSDWEETRLLQTILGRHLLVKENGVWRHLDADTLAPMPVPGAEDLTRLLQDAFTMNPDRYGRVATIDESRITTDTDVWINLDWNTLSLDQDGWDSRAIARVYDIHYLEWTGNYWIDKVLGLSGLFLLLYMTWTGMQMSFGWRLKKERPNGAANLPRSGEASHA